jgi:hypothetical protein
MKKIIPFLFLLFLAGPVFASDIYNYSAGTGSIILDNTIGVSSMFYGTSGGYGFGGDTLPISTPVSFFTIQTIDGLTCPDPEHIIAYSGGGGILFSGFI